MRRILLVLAILSAVVMAGVALADDPDGHIQNAKNLLEQAQAELDAAIAVPQPTVTETVTATVTQTVTVTATSPPPAPGCTGTDVPPGPGLKAAVDAAPAGTTFCLSAGTYTVNANIDLDGDTIDGAGPAATIIDGAGLPLINGNMEAADIFTARGANVLIKDVDMRNAPTPAVTAGFTGSSYGLAVRNLAGTTTLQNVACHDNGGACVGQAGSVVADNIDCYANGSNYSMQSSIRYAACIKVVAAYAQGEGGMLVTNSNIHDNPWVGLWCDFCKEGFVDIENNVIDHNGARGIQYEASGGWTVRDHAYVAGNTITDNGWRTTDPAGSPVGQRGGLLISTAADITAENNTFGGQAVNGASGVFVLFTQSRVPWPEANVVARNNTMNGDVLTGCSIAGVTCSSNG